VRYEGAVEVSSKVERKLANECGKRERPAKPWRVIDVFHFPAAGGRAKRRAEESVVGVLFGGGVKDMQQERGALVKIIPRPIYN